MFIVKVATRASVEWLPWLSGGGPPVVGEWVRIQTFSPYRSPYVELVTVVDISKIIAVKKVDWKLSSVTDAKSRKLIGVLARCTPAAIEQHHVTQRLNDEINELLRDAAAGRWDASQSKHAAFLRDVPQQIRRRVEELGPMYCWIRAAHEPENEHKGGLEFSRTIFILSRPCGSFKAFVDFFAPLARFLRVLPEKRCVVVSAEDRFDSRGMPEGIELSFDEHVYGLGGPSIVYSRDGALERRGGGGGGGENVGAAAEQHQPPSFSRAEDALRRAAEFSSEERRWIIEQLQREFGGGEPARRRERSAPPVAAAAGSAASMLIPPPLVVVDGVVVPPPSGINPLVFPPPMNIAA